jgi:predicted lipid-binding transport protein (Tim44 family)
MTPAPPTAPSAGYAQPYGARRPGFGGGFGGGLLGGLLAGGLIGGMMGHGWGWGGGPGAGGGMLAILLQLAVLGGIVWLGLRMFRGRATTVPSFGGGAAPSFGGGVNFGGPALQPSVPFSDSAAQIAITPADRDAFERLLIEVQDAFGREDYGRLREKTTPEVMSYLAEELSQNATHGRRNEVTGTRLIQSDVSEAWREGDADYATAALRYESIDIMRDRISGAIVAGDPSRPTQATELWTFVRQGGGPWKLSAIQEA